MRSSAGHIVPVLILLSTVGGCGGTDSPIDPTEDGPEEPPSVTIETAITSAGEPSVGDEVTVSVRMDMSEFSDPLEGFEVYVTWDSTLLRYIEGSSEPGATIPSEDFFSTRLQREGYLQLVGVNMDGSGYADDRLELTQFELRGLEAGAVTIEPSGFTFSVRKAQELSEFTTVEAAGSTVQIQ